MNLHVYVIFVYVEYIHIYTRVHIVYTRRLRTNYLLMLLWDYV